jgi:hypothetical protein
LRAWSTTSRLPRIAGHGRVVGAKRRLADRQRPLILSSCTFQARQAVGMDAPEPTAGHPLGHPPGPPSKMDTLLGLLDGRERTPRRTAAAADPMAGTRVPPVVCSRPSLRVGRGARMTNDPVRLCGRPRRPSARVSAVGGGPRPGIRVGVQPSKAGASIPTAMVRVIVKRLARQSPSRPCERPGRMTIFAQVLRALNSGPDQGKRSPCPA